MAKKIVTGAGNTGAAPAGRTARAAYLLGAAAVAASHMAGVMAGFLSFWLLARILTKEMFGGYVFAMAVVALLGVVATLGLDRSLLLRVAGLRERAEYLHGGGLALRTLLIACGAGTSLAVAVILLAPHAVRAGTIEEAAWWLPALAAAIPATAAALTMSAWMKANHRVPVAVAVPGLTDVFRCAFLGVAFVGGLGAAGVAGSVVLAAALPAALLAWLGWRRARRSPGRLRASDIVLGCQFVTMRLTTESMRTLDLVLMGLLATAAGTAEYAVAARIAVVADYARNAIKPSFTPRARRWIAIGDKAAAAREYETTRAATFAAALIAAASLTLLGGPLLRFFGPFESAYGPLLLIAAGYVLNAGFGMHATFLAMSGEVGWSTIVRVCGLAIFVVLNVVLIPKMGALGAAVTALLVQLYLNMAGAFLAWRLTGLKAATPGTLLMISLAVACLGLAALDLIDPMAGGIALLIAAAVPAWRLRGLVVEAVMEALAKKGLKPLRHP